MLKFWGYAVVDESNDIQHRSASVGLASMLVLAGWIIFQPFFAWIMELGWQGKVIGGLPIYEVINYRYALSVLLLVFLVGAILVTLLKETYSKH